MKSRASILFSIFLIIVILTFLTIKITNRNIERIYKNASYTTFQLLSEIADNYLKRDIELNRIEINNLKDRGFDILKGYLQNNNVSLNGGIDGVWIFSDTLIKGLTVFPESQGMILDFYYNRLKGKDYGTLINLDGGAFYLVNVINQNYNILLLSKSTHGETLGITRVLDSLVLSSNLVYFSILDENESAVIYSSIYEGFLPIEGEGSYIILTPQGKIFQIEQKKNGESIIAGFSMEPLERIVAINRVLLIVTLAGFSVLLGFLLYNLSKSEKYRTDKEREIRHLEEIGALSSGFSHEIRNSLNTLSLLARNIEGEQGNILKEEVRRMNVVMDSIKLLILSEVDKTTIDIDNTIGEAISLTDNRNNSVEIKLESTIKLKIRGNRSLLVSAFSNILKNAVEADANKISIIMRKTGNILRIIVIDNGKGVERDKTSRVFEPFYSNKRQSGLGLYLTRKIIEYHGGSIKLESGKETKVDILLPIKD